MLTVSPVTICNLALDAVPASPITSLSEDSLEARLCARQFPQNFNETLEAWNWRWATVRAQLAAMPNDRPQEWLYKYAVPADCALPLRLLPGDLTTVSDAGLGQPHGFGPFDYEILGDALYCNAADATLDHIDYRVAPPGATALFVRAVSLKIASRISITLTRDQKREASLLQQAEVFEQRARAQEYNREPHLYGDFIPEAVLFRMGGDPSAPLGSLGAPILGNTGSGGDTQAPGGGVVTPPPGDGGVIVPPPPPPPSTQLYTFPDWVTLFDSTLSFRIR